MRKSRIIAAGAMAGVAAAALAAGPAIAHAASVPSVTVAKASAVRPDFTPYCEGTTTLTVNQAHSIVVTVPTTSNGSGNWRCLLEQGNAGPAVRRLQFALDACNGQHLAQDGIYGHLTAGAVLRVQEAHNARPFDGIYGPVTAAAMSWPLAGATRTPCAAVL